MRPSILDLHVQVTTDSRDAVVGSTEIENPHRLLVGRFDLASVLIFFYPILILALSYNMLSAEQEQGTLALTLSQALSLATFASGKVLLRAIILVGTVVVCTLAALVIGGVDLAGPGDLPRLALWVAVVVACGAFWFGLAMLLETRSLAITDHSTT